jgi:PAS domain S-box-containing protein
MGSAAETDKHDAAGDPLPEKTDQFVGAGAQPSPLRFVLATALPPLGAFVIEWFYYTTSARWSLYYPAVFLSSLFGGLRSGVAATWLSAALVWWFFISPVETWIKPEAKHGLAGAIFVVMGTTFSLLHDRMRRANREAAESLALSERTNERLNKVLDERRVFQALIENSSDFIGIADAEGTPTYLNPAGRRMVGLPSDFPLETTEIPDYYPQDLRAFVETVIVKEMTEKGLWQGETFFRNWRTQQSIPVSDTHFMIRDPRDGRVLGMATITRDISELKRARDEVDFVVKQLRRTTNDLLEAQRLAHIGSWSWDRATDAVRWSEELYRIAGRDPALGPPRLHVVPIYTPESTEALEAAIRKILRDGEPYEIDLEVLRPDGETRWVTAHGEAARDPSGHIVGLNGTAQDITELRQLQRQREEWMSVIGHDLRQPIGTITMAADMLRELHTGATAQAERDMTDRIRSAAVGLARMVDDLLDMSRIETHRLSLDLRTVDPAAMVREALTRLAHVIKDRRVRVSESSTLAPVRVDPARIDQVLGNLISNAVKYGDANGAIDIRLDRGAEEIEIAVTNRGRGVSAEELPRLFDRFMRSKSARGSDVQGLGVGLYVAKGLVEAHGGRIWAESIPGQTTTIRFTLPIAADVGDRAAERRRVA